MSRPLARPSLPADVAALQRRVGALERRLAPRQRPAAADVGGAMAAATFPLLVYVNSGLQHQHTGALWMPAALPTIATGHDQIVVGPVAFPDTTNNLVVVQALDGLDDLTVPDGSTLTVGLRLRVGNADATQVGLAQITYDPGDGFPDDSGLWSTTLVGSDLSFDDWTGSAVAFTVAGPMVLWIVYTVTLTVDFGA